METSGRKPTLPAATPQQTSSSGKAPPRIPQGLLAVRRGARLSASKDALIWPEETRDQIDFVKPTGATFSDFIQLHRSPPDRILRFAKKWGQLHLDRDGQFLGRHPPFWPEGATDAAEEPISGWRFFSGRAYATLELIAALRHDRAAAPEHVRALMRRDHLSCSVWAQIPPATDAWRSDGDFPWESITAQRRFLQAETDLWLKFSGLSFGMKLQEKKQLSLYIDYGGQLLPMVALQLAMTASGANVILLCSHCKQMYPRTRKAPNPGTANYCDECRKSKDNLVHGDQRRRDRIQRARQLHREGLSLKEIARDLNTERLAMVQRWIEKGK